jgi:hypothetical protein
MLKYSCLQGILWGGGIPTELGQIQGGTLNFDGNELSGSIPTEIFGMTTLTALNF